MTNTDKLRRLTAALAVSGIISEYEKLHLMVIGYWDSPNCLETADLDEVVDELGKVERIARNIQDICTGAVRSLQARTLEAAE